MTWYLFMLACYLPLLHACPTCIGSLKTESHAPFFSDEHYKQSEQYIPADTHIQKEQSNTIRSEEPT